MANWSYNSNIKVFNLQFSYIYYVSKNRNARKLDTNDNVHNL